VRTALAEGGSSGQQSTSSVRLLTSRREDSGAQDSGRHGPGTVADWLGDVTTKTSHGRWTTGSSRQERDKQPHGENERKERSDTAGGSRRGRVKKRRGGERGDRLKAARSRSEDTAPSGSNRGDRDLARWQGQGSGHGSSEAQDSRAARSRRRKRERNKNRNWDGPSGSKTTHVCQVMDATKVACRADRQHRPGQRRHRTSDGYVDVAAVRDRQGRNLLRTRRPEIRKTENLRLGAPRARESTVGIPAGSRGH